MALTLSGRSQTARHLPGPSGGQGAMTGDAYAATAAGFGWLLSKPIDPADLLAALEAPALDAGV